MPNINQMRESKFLKQSDVEKPALVTIDRVIQMNVAKEGADPENKWCVVFHEFEKPLVLNFTNLQVCAKVCGSEDTDDWTGKRVVLYVDPNVSYQGKIVGGIRIRAPKANAVLPPVVAPPVVEDDFDAPF